jgi:hypothetical protein
MKYRVSVCLTPIFEYFSFHQFCCNPWCVIAQIGFHKGGSWSVKESEEATIEFDCRPRSLVFGKSPVEHYDLLAMLSFSRVYALKAASGG